MSIKAEIYQLQPTLTLCEALELKSSSKTQSLEVIKTVLGYVKSLQHKLGVCNFNAWTKV